MSLGQGIIGAVNGLILALDKVQLVLVKGHWSTVFIDHYIIPNNGILESNSLVFPWNEWYILQ